MSTIKTGEDETNASDFLLWFSISICDTWHQPSIRTNGIDALIASWSHTTIHYNALYILYEYVFAYLLLFIQRMVEKGWNATRIKLFPRAVCVVNATLSIMTPNGTITIMSKKKREKGIDIRLILYQWSQWKRILIFELKSQ